MPSIYNERVHTVEYSIIRSTMTDMYHIEKDGLPLTTQKTLQDAHASAARDARNNKHTSAGLTECFGRNRQFVIGPRWGWHRWKEV